MTIPAASTYCIAFASMYLRIDNCVPCIILLVWAMQEIPPKQTAGSRSRSFCERVISAAETLPIPHVISHRLLITSLHQPDTGNNDSIHVMIANKIIYPPSFVIVTRPFSILSSMTFQLKLAFSFNFPLCNKSMDLHLQR